MSRFRFSSHCAGKTTTWYQSYFRNKREKMNIDIYAMMVALALGLSSAANRTEEMRRFHQGLGHAEQAVLHHTVLTEDGHECKFPFRYGGSLFHSCISNAFSLKKWCSTTHNYDRDRAWGYCDVSSREYLAKCFDESLYEYFGAGESWARIYQGLVQQCTCENGHIECQPAQYTDCTINPCLHGSSCRKIISTGRIVCGCKKPFVGRYCSINLSHLCYPGNGTEYRGIGKQTTSGDNCLAWNSDFLYQELQANVLQSPEQFGVGAYSYCR
ncbi:hypothetical protein lerEdw1_011996 [Lerista edwardsae]|nr:hypothetical protein lerEdw1_011996 [Lerista edwardsae]